MEINEPEKLISFAGVVAILLGALKWLTTDRKAVLKLLDESRKESSELREQRGADWKESATLLATSGELVKASMAQVEKQLNDLQAALMLYKTEMVGSDQTVKASIDALTKSIDELKGAMEGKQWVRDSSQG